MFKFLIDKTFCGVIYGLTIGWWIEEELEEGRDRAFVQVRNVTVENGDSKNQIVYNREINNKLRSEDNSNIFGNRDNSNKLGNVNNKTMYGNVKGIRRSKLNSTL